MDFTLDHGTALLARMPATLDALLRGLPEEWTHQTEGPGTWSAFDVVGHLIHTDRTDWLPRARVILQYGESQPFPPFDREGHKHECAGKSLDQLLDEFARIRAEQLDALRAMNLQPQDLERTGKHPSFGSVRLGQLLATWPTHDLNHLHQVARILAAPCRPAIGPWHRFLGVMQCNGHGAAS